MFGSFDWNGANLLSLEHQFRVFTGDEGEQASDRGQTSIARCCGASALLLDVIKEGEYDFLGDVFDD